MGRDSLPAVDMKKNWSRQEILEGILKDPVTKRRPQRCADQPVLEVKEEAGETNGQGTR